MSEILFADDDEALRRMIGELLRHAGHAVRLAENGHEALAEVRRAAPDLVILDYRMGTPDGFTVCRTIKDDPRVAHVPVLILTGESRIEDRLGGFEAGADDYLAKPFDARELLARVTALLRQAQRALDRNPTTGLPGGVAIEREIDRRRAGGQPFSVVYFDLDDFKPFADRFGFAVADEAIREAGRSIAATAKGGRTPSWATWAATTSSWSAPPKTGASWPASPARASRRRSRTTCPRTRCGQASTGPRTARGWSASSPSPACPPP